MVSVVTKIKIFYIKGHIYIQPNKKILLFQITRDVGCNKINILCLIVVPNTED